MTPADQGLEALQTRGLGGHQRSEEREREPANQLGQRGLRALDRGWSIRIVKSDGNTVGINSAEDYERFVASCAAMTAKEKGGT